MKLTLRTYPDPCLSMVCEPVDPSDLGTVLTTAVPSLRALMTKHKGAGLAAPQANLNYRLFVAVEGYGCPSVVINPSIRERSLNEEPYPEGCLSLPGEEWDVRRPRSIEVAYWDENGKEVIKELKGFAARLFLHEYDHLDGVLIANPTPRIL